MTDPAYQRLGLPATASPFAVLRAAVRALHPDTRAVSGFRAARKRFYRQMLLRACRATGGGRQSHTLIAPQLPFHPNPAPGLSAGSSPFRRSPWRITSPISHA